MLRNAAVHGIEPPEVRRAQLKEDAGTVLVEFRKSADGYELVFEDDGAGIAPDTLKAAAVKPSSSPRTRRPAWTRAPRCR